MEPYSFVQPTTTKKTYFYNFIPSKAEEIALAAANRPFQVTSLLMEVRDIFPLLPVDPANPWQIRKKVTSGEINLEKLILSYNEAFDHVFRHWSLETTNYVSTGHKLQLIIWDVTDAKNPVKITSENAFFERGLNDTYTIGWTDLVRKNRVSAGDEIGMYWDGRSCSFCLVTRSSTFQLKILYRAI